MSGRFLAEFELHVMLAIARLKENASGASIRHEIEERTGRVVAVGALYATLSRLGEKALLEFTISLPQSTRGGRAKKRYRLTPAGREAAEHSSNMLRRMMQGTRFAPQSGDGS
jgi:DNA-binding PadR family transcriptional regulator